LNARSRQSRPSAITGTETGHGRFVLNKYGRPYSYGGFDQAFDDWCDQAGLPEQCTAHGVRKAAAALMYENGASEAELCAIFGWKIAQRRHSMIKPSTIAPPG
jgi:integrase